MKLHWIPVNIGDYLKATQLMSLEEQGAYNRLKIVSASQDPPGSLPYDDAKIARILCVPVEDWKRLKSVCLQEWVVIGGRLINTEVSDHHKKSENISEKRQMAVAAREAKRRRATS